MTKQIATVTFHGTPLTVITHDSLQLVAMKPIVEAIGLQWEAQYKRIQRHPVLKAAMSIMDIPSSGGVQRTACLPLDYLNGWLFGVDVNRVREEIRDTLIQYQRECYQVLAAYWQKGETINPRPQTDLVGSVIGSTGLTVLDRVIDQKAMAVDKSLRRSFKHTMKSRLRNRFNVQRADLIPADNLADACNFVAAYALEGEYLGQEPGGVMTEDDLYKVFLLSNHMSHLYKIFNKYKMYEALKALGSRAGIEMIDHILDGNHHAHHLISSYAQALDDYQRKHRLNHYRDVA